MNTDPTVVIVHGAYGSPEENWFPWLKEKVIGVGWRALVPKLPTPDGQRLDRWREAFRQQIGEVGAEMVLVGHSVGASFLLTVVEESPVRVRGMFLASGFVGNLGKAEFDGINDTFVNRAFDWERIRGNAETIRVYNSDNDPYVPLEKGRELAARLGVELRVVHGAGHINAASGYTRFDALWRDIQTSGGGKAEG